MKERRKVSSFKDESTCTGQTDNKGEGARVGTRVRRRHRLIIKISIFLSKKIVFIKNTDFFQKREKTTATTQIIH